MWSASKFLNKPNVSSKLSNSSNLLEQYKVPDDEVQHTENHIISTSNENLTRPPRIEEGSMGDVPIANSLISSGNEGTAYFEPILPDDLILDPSVGIEIDKIHTTKMKDTKVLDTFAWKKEDPRKHILKWTCPLDSFPEYLILTDMPGFNSETSCVQHFDENASEFIENTLNEVLGEKNWVAITCVVGHQGNKFKTEPTAYELAISINYLTSFIKAIPSIKFIATIGNLATHVARRHFDVHKLLGYVKDAHIPFIAETPKLNGKVDDQGECFISAHNAYRTFYLPAPPNHTHYDQKKVCKEFSARLRLFAFNAKNYKPIELSSKPYIITDHPEVSEVFENEANKLKEQQLQWPLPDYKEMTAEICKQDILKAEHPVYKALLSKPHLELETPDSIRYIKVNNTMYDRISNSMLVAAATPRGNMMLLTVKNVEFSFMFTPHIAFSDDKMGWPQTPEMYNERLQLHHMHTFFETIQKKLSFLFRKYRKVLPASLTENDCIKFELQKTNRITVKGATLGTHTVVKCTVFHHDYIEHIVRNIKRTMEAHRRLERAHDISVTAYDWEPFFILEQMTAEEEFTHNYNIHMSKWHKIEDFAQFELDPLPVNTYQPYFTARAKASKSPFSITSLDPIKKIPIVEEPIPLTSSDLQPVKMVSFDIESYSPDQHFPSPLKDPVITICCVCQIKTPTSAYNDKDTKDANGKVIKKANYTPKDGYFRVHFMLGNTALTDEDLSGERRTYCFNDEREMLKAFNWWRHYIMPDYFISHNGKRFDETYLAVRSQVLGIQLAPIGLVSYQQMRIDQRKFQSVAVGERIITSIFGVLGPAMIDTLEVFLRDQKVRSYTLGFLASLFVGMKKNDMPYVAIAGYFRSSPESRATLLAYCDRDSQLVDQLVNRHQIITTIVEDSRVHCTVPETRLYETGQQEKINGILHLIKREIKQNLVLPTFRDNFKNKPPKDYTTADLDDIYLFEKMEEKEIKEVFWKQLVIEKEPDTKDENPRQLTAVTKAKINMKNKLGTQPITSFFSAEKKITSTVVTQKEPVNKRRRKGGTKQAVLKTNVVTDSNGVKTYTTSSSADKKDIQAQIYRQKWDEKIRKYQERKQKDSLKPEKVRLKEQLDRIVKVKNDVRVGKYKGATVMDVPLGFFPYNPAICLDAASLYPSLIISNNSSSDTKLLESDFTSTCPFTREMCNLSPIKDVNPRTGEEENLYFVKKEHLKGLIPQTCEYLLGLRKKANAIKDSYAITIFDPETKQWKPNPDYNPIQESIWNLRQLKLKIYANSVYGVTGASGKNEDKAVAATTTGLGRIEIDTVRKLIEDEFGGICVGGDTDSVFMIFPGKDGKYRITTVKEAEEFALEILVPRINSMYVDRPPMRFAYEKCMLCLITLAKKRYIASIHEEGKPGVVKSKGTESVRRDSINFTKNALDALQNAIIVPRRDDETEEEYREQTERRKDQFIESIRTYARAMLSGNLATASLVMSKQLSKENYNTDDLPHVQVAKKLTKRGMDAPKLGERVPFLLTDIPGDDILVSDMAEDPAHVIENEIPLNYPYYLKNYFAKPVTRLARIVLRDRISKMILEKSGYDIEADSTLTDKQKLEIIGMETESFLFMHNESIKKVKDLRLRYLALSNYNCKARYSRDTKLSPITQFSVVKNTQLLSAQSRHQTQDPAIILEKEGQEVEKANVAAENALRTCRECLKTEEIVCRNTDCGDFYTRVESCQRKKRLTEQFEILKKEIEGTVDQTVEFNDDIENLIIVSSKKTTPAPKKRTRNQQTKKPLFV
jgi:DNA polymerase elongation subunit (family B)